MGECELYIKIHTDLNTNTIIIKLVYSAIYWVFNPGLLHQQYLCLSYSKMFDIIAINLNGMVKYVGTFTHVSD